MKQKKVLVILAIAIVTLIISCTKDDFQETTGLCPIVLSTSPTNSATGVPLNQVITVTFNEAVNPATLTQTSFTIVGASAGGGSTNLTGVIAYSGVTATFSPSANLSTNTTYIGKVTTAVKDVNGNALQEDYLFTFSTGATLQPVVIANSPSIGETGVVLNKAISTTFNMPMDATTINATTFTLKQGATVIPGVVTYSGNNAVFTPNANLTANTIYTATLTTGVKNTVNTSILADYVWNFVTGVNIAPKVVLTDPLNNAINVNANKILNVTFGMAMNPLTITGSTFTLKQGTNIVAGVVTYSGTIASFTPSSPLLSNANYTATITMGAQNVAGVGLANDYVWNFATLNSSIAPNLATATQFGAFSGNGGVSNQGLNTVINGSIGTTVASTLMTGFHDATAVYTETAFNVGHVIGSAFAAPPIPGTAASLAIATQGLQDANTAYISMSPASIPGGIDAGAGELGGLTLTPGVYKSASGTFKISNGDLTLDAQGNPNATWIFQTTTGLTVGVLGTTGAKSVILTNSALAKNVFWYVGGTATINSSGGGTMVGTIIANSGVNISTTGNVVQTTLNGRAISLVSAVTMVNTTINVPQ